MLYMGIDPGAKGGIAVLQDRKIYYLQEYSDENLIDIIFKMPDYQGVVCAVEKVWGFPGQSAQGVFNFGMNFGIIQGILKANNIPYQLITPKKWKSEYLLNSDKNKSIDVAKRLFPRVNLKRTERCKKDHDGMAEALLIAEYGRRKL